MMRISLSRLWLAGTTGALLVAAAACGASLGLPPATLANEVDTTTLFALRGTAITLPSAYDIVNRDVSRTDLGEDFDFVFDIDSTGAAIIIPRSLLGLTSQAGLQRTETAFASLDRAPTDGYSVDEALVIEEDVVFLARSRVSQQFCVFLGSLPRYGKFRVLELNPTERSVTVEFLVNTNCGFRNLTPGIPDA